MPAWIVRRRLLIEGDEMQTTFHTATPAELCVVEGGRELVLAGLLAAGLILHRAHENHTDHYLISNEMLSWADQQSS